MYPISRRAIVISILWILAATVAAGSNAADMAATGQEVANAPLDATRLGTVGLIGARAASVGTIHRLGLEDGLAPVVLVFLDTTCPISRRFVPRLGELADLASSRDVRFYGVVSDPGVTWKEAAAFAEEYGITFPILFDASGVLAAKVRPEIVPEAFVISRTDRLTYRGRIDDRFAAVGTLRSEITRHDLRDAITGISGGTLGAPMVTQAVGCVFEAWRGGMSEKVTYTRDVAPILRGNCVECHQAGGIGPFPLETYAQADRRSEMMAFVVRDRLMPPWRAAPGFGHFRDQRILSDREIEVLVAWAKAGAPEGDPQDLLPFAPPPASGWRLGEPDLVLTMEEPFEVPAAGDDVYRYFVLPGGLERYRDVVAIDFRPGDPSVVHHANIFIDYGGRGRQLDRRDPGPGFSVFGTGGFMSYDDAGAIGGWAPGADPQRLPEGFGMGLPGGGDVVVEIHYHLTGKKTLDQSSVAFYYAEEPVERYVDGFIIGSQDLDIPAGDADYRQHVRMQVPAGITLTDVTPHMHYLGSEAKAVATLPDGRELPLIHIPDWDLRWQNLYTFREPIHLPAGSRIDAWFSWDNSSANPANPHRPPERVRWGWGSDDEMCELWVTFVPDDPSDRKQIIRASRASWMSSAAVTASAVEEPEAMLARLTATGLWTAEATGLLDAAWAADELDGLLEHARLAARKNKRDADALAVYAGLLSIKTFYDSSQNLAYARWTQAERAFDRALTLAPDHWGARLGKAVLYLYSEDADLLREAGRMLEQLAELQAASTAQARHAKTFVYLGEFFRLSGQEQQAELVWSQAAARFPEDPELAGKLRSGT